MAEQDLIRLARENLEAFNAGDWQRYRVPLAPDAVHEEVATKQRMQGPDQIVQLAQGWKQAFPDARGTIKNAFASGDKVALEITYEGTQTGPLAGPGGTIPPSGKRAVVQGAQVITFQGDKIKEIREYFDLMTLLQQIGAAPQ